MLLNDKIPVSLQFLARGGGGCIHNSVLHLEGGFMVAIT